MLEQLDIIFTVLIALDRITRSMGVLILNYNGHLPAKRFSILEENKLLWQALLWIYLILLFVFVVVKFDGSVDHFFNRIDSYQLRWEEYGIRNVNLIPFHTIMSQLRWIGTISLVNLAANLTALAPFGFLLPLACEETRGLGRIFLLSLALTLGIEVFQLVTFLGSFDVDDILLNLIGALAGYGALEMVFPRKQRIGST